MLFTHVIKMVKWNNTTTHVIVAFINILVSQHMWTGTNAAKNWFQQLSRSENCWHYFSQAFNTCWFLCVLLVF